jgi:RNA polymerase sigma-70 factor (ECF subfamily)
MDRDQEKAMVKSCQNGDREALEKLVRQMQKPIYNAAFRMLGNPDLAADITQTTFLKVFENIQQFDHERRIFSWTYRIAINESIDQLKKGKRVEPLTEAPVSDSASPQQQAASSQLADEVQATLMELGEDHRAVITLRHFSDCSYEDISRILQIPEKTVKSRLFSARQQLKSKLQEHGVFSS